MVEPLAGEFLLACSGNPGYHGEVDYDYYNKRGDAIDQDTWLVLMQDPTYKVIKKTPFECVSGEGEVSTVWLGVDHDWLQSKQPLIFETVIFCNCTHDFVDRYRSEDEAIVGHFLLLKAHRNVRSWVLTNRQWVEAVPTVDPHPADSP